MPGFLRYIEPDHVYVMLDGRIVSARGVGVALEEGLTARGRSFRFRRAELGL